MPEHSMKKWRREWNDIRRSLRLEGSFVQNSAWMFTSSGVSILIQFIFFPILARIYSPEAYGLFGVFNFYSTTLGNAMTLGYNQAFVLPHDRREFTALLHLTIRIALFIGLCSFLFTCIGGEWFLKLMHHEQMGIWMYMITPVALLMALDRVTSDWAIRNREFRRQTVVSTGVTLASRVFNVVYGSLISATASGLILTTLLQHLLRMVGYSWWVITDTTSRIRERFSWSELKRVAAFYKEYPLFIYWGNVLNIFSAALPAALLPALGFGLESVGYFGYSMIILDLPLRMLGSGVASVFQQKAAELQRERPDQLHTHTVRLFRSLVFISVLFTLFIFFAGEPLYALFFGEQWREAGHAAEWLVIYYFFRMITSPLTVLYTILRKEREYFVFQIALTVSRALSLLVGALITDSFIGLMIIFSLTNALLYAWLAVRVLRLSKSSSLITK
jgi:O-antigen/teichoic acid export membrane protein